MFWKTVWLPSLCLQSCISFHRTAQPVFNCSSLAARGSLVSVFEQTGAALIIQANQARICYCCYFYYRGAGGSSLLGWMECAALWHWNQLLLSLSARVITTSLQANTRTFSQHGFLLKCFTVCLSHAHDASSTVSSWFFYRACFVRTGAFPQCDTAFK